MGISSFIPAPIRRRIMPWVNRVRLGLSFKSTPGYGLYRNRDVGEWVAVRPFGERAGAIVVRSYREMRRWKTMELSGDSPDLVYKTLMSCPKLGVFYDIGASSGVYGFMAHAVHDCKIVFVEPYTPSIETILKTVYVAQGRGAGADDFEIVHAGIDEKDGFGKMSFHGVPIAGETRNSFQDTGVYVGEDRSKIPVQATQWVKGVCLDDLVDRYGLPVPDMVKIDVDGFEARAIRGAAALIKSRRTEAFLIEINSDENRIEIDQAMTENGYVCIAVQKHYGTAEDYVGDWLYVRDDRVDSWKGG